MALNDFIKGINEIQDSLNGDENPLSDTRNKFKSDGFTVPPSFSADGNGLPYSKVPTLTEGQINRNIITWFVPEFGIARMYVNPERITYNHKKVIQKDRTKGGYTIQYWGEELSTMSISGTTGSSGIEGINMLYEIYRAEQYAFDSYGLSIESQNSNSSLGSNLSNTIGSAISDTLGGGSNLGSAIGGFVGDVTGLNSTALVSQNIPSLAQLAFSLEMYYGGSVHRGYFESMVINEKANDFLIDYSMNFVITQKRGYRTNYFPFHKNPSNGPSNYDTPNSFKKGTK